MDDRSRCSPERHSTSGDDALPPDIEAGLQDFEFDLDQKGT
jgi:hypothetical protein